MSNYDIRMFRNSILSYINQSPLPAEVKLLAVKDIASQLEAEANKAVMQEAAELEKANELKKAAEQKKVAEHKNEAKKSESEVINNGT